MDKSNNNKASEIASKITQNIAECVVGIGCSAGSLDALKGLFSALPKDTSAAYIIVQHLSPDFDSLMDEILKKYSSMPIKMAKDMDIIESNTVYLLGHRQFLSVADNRIILSEMLEEVNPHPIDYFFKSIAEEYQNRAVGIILSGAGNDGANGMLQLNGVGALCIAQDPKDAEFESMPSNAIETGYCQQILPVDKIGPFLKQYFSDHSYISNEIKKAHFYDHMEQIFAFIKKASNIDFSEYKVSTAERRILHRMGVLEITSSSDYLEYVSRESKELDLLIKDMFISVTQFFRDPKSWEYLYENIIKSLLLEKSEDDLLRVWVPGCASGEEAYTIAILFEEAQRELDISRKVSIFATDLDRHTARSGGEGVFELSSKIDIPKELLARYFVEIDNQLIINKVIREKVVFATHNVAFDPPFSRMDLVSCRNLLIYFQPSAQKKILSYFHFSLTPTGYLILGSAETASALGDYYTAIEPKHRIYKKNPEARISLVDAGLNTNILSRAKYEFTTSHLPKSASASSQLQLIMAKVKDHLIKNFVPPTFILNQECQLVYSFGETDLFTRKVRPGISSLHYSNVLHNEITPFVTTGIKNHEATNKEVHIENISFLEHKLRLNLYLSYIEHINTKGSGFYIITIQTLTELSDNQVSEEQQIQRKSQMGQQIIQLDAALLQASNLINEKQQDIDSITEELQCSNEELMAANEELQSSNEELQSVNEELYTVNSEYQEKIKELESVNYDLDNLLKSTQMGVIYLDEHLLIRRFTSKARDFVKLLPMDLNRPFSDLSLTFSNDKIYEWLRDAKGSRKQQTYQINSFKNQKIELSINPYIDKHDNLEGLILVFKFI